MKQRFCTSRRDETTRDVAVARRYDANKTDEGRPTSCSFMRRCVVHCADLIAAAAARRTLINPHQWQIALHRSLTRCKLGVGRLGSSARNPIISGVTRVGVTRGGNWGCHPYFFLKKNWRPFFSYHRFPVLRVSPLFIFSWKVTTSFAHHRHFYWLHLGALSSPL